MIAENRQFTATPEQYLELGKKLREGGRNLKTAEELEKITDRAKFELLVTSVLRKDDRDYAAIVHTGINAQGETIRSPLDGFCRVPGSVPPRFILVEHTTTDKDGLEKKWLYDHSTAKSTNVSESKDGDLLKAGREAQKVRKDFPDAKFTVILTTNQHLPKGVELLKKVYKKAAELGVDVDIWEQSRLVDFLNSTHEGHWLRKKYLHIEAQMLSQSLLGSLCKQSLANYEKQFLTSPNSWVSREIESRIEKGTHTNRYTIQIFIGESGSGKSAAAYQLLKKHLGSGGYGLWISDELLRECTSLETTIDRVLRDLYPSLLPDAGRVALRLLPKGSRLLLIVDDVNRANNPTRQVENLVNWSKPKQSEPSDSPSSFSPYLVVCPVCPQILGSISRDLKETAWVNNVFISSMTSAEGMVAVQATTSDAGMEITNTEAISLATSLGNDPILIGLFASLLSSTQPCELNGLTENVVERFIKTAINQVSSSPGTLLEIEYRDALSSLTTFMLKNRRLFPLWKEIRDWFRESPDELTALRELTGHEKLCRLTTEDKFVFRHDRIQQALLVESMIELLAEITLDSEILYEPFYAEIIGQAIARSPQSKEFLRQLQKRLPLALVEAIRCFANPTTDYHQAIVEEVKKWVNSSVATGFVTESVLGAVCWSLLETNSPVVLEITEKFPKWPLVLLARFRNGCAVSGVRYYCVIHSQNYFAPASRDDLRAQAIEQAKHYHREKLLEELKQLLISCTATDEERRGALALAGFLSFTELQDEMKTCWTLATNKTQVLSEAIWVAFQGSVAKYGKLLDELIAYWDSLPDDQYGYGDSPKAIVTADLRSALCHGTSDEVISYLLAQSDIHKSLYQDINYIFRCINTPDAIEFVVRNAADLDISNYPDRLSQATVMLDFDLEWNSGFSDSPRLSQASRNRLKALWKEPKNDEFLKEIAFHVWEIGIEQDEIHTLKEIPSNSPLYRRALRKRAELEDRSVIPSFLSLLSEENYGFSVAQYVWCDEIMLELKRYLNTFNNSIPKDFSGESLHEHNIVSWLLTRIPENDAETLLDECWSHLGYSPLFIQTALYVGTPKCLELVADSISKCRGDIPLLKYFSHHFRLNDANSKKYLDSGKLQKIVQNLLPYLDRLDDFQLWQLAEACKKFKIFQWSQEHLLPRLTDEFRRRCHPSDDDLLQALDIFSADKDGEWRVTRWLEEFDKRYDLQSRVLSIVDCWLAFSPTLKGLQIAAACVQAVGTRKDLSILEQYTIEGSPDEIAKIKESTRFAVYRRSLD